MGLDTASQLGKHNRESVIPYGKRKITWTRDADARVAYFPAATSIVPKYPTYSIGVLLARSLGKKELGSSIRSKQLRARSEEQA